MRYIEMYAKHHGIMRCVKHEHDVVKVRKNCDHADSGRWLITVKDIKADTIEDIIVDGVMVCTGHHVEPNLPHFEGQERFRGKILHSHDYKVPRGLEDKVVVVVGVGNSGLDVAVELSSLSKQVYLSTRRGTWVMSRLGGNGYPLDCANFTRANALGFNALPLSISATYFESLLNKQFDHALYGLKPRHRVFEQDVTVNDLLPNRILSGTIAVKHNISRFTETGVIFEGDKEETTCDCVILATGYSFSFPFLDGVLEVDSRRLELYKHVFAPQLAHAHTLAFIGLTQQQGPIFPTSEMQSRWVAMLLTGKLRLPGSDAMAKSVERQRREIQARYYKADRNTLQSKSLNIEF